MLEHREQRVAPPQVPSLQRLLVGLVRNAAGLSLAYVLGVCMFFVAACLVGVVAHVSWNGALLGWSLIR